MIWDVVRVSIIIRFEEKGISNEKHMTMFNNIHKLVSMKK